MRPAGSKKKEGDPPFLATLEPVTPDHRTKDRRQTIPDQCVPHCAPNVAPNAVSVLACSDIPCTPTAYHPSFPDSCGTPISAIAVRTPCTFSKNRVDNLSQNRERISDVALHPAISRKYTYHYFAESRVTQSYFSPRIPSPYPEYLLPYSDPSIPQYTAWLRFVQSPPRHHSWSQGTAATQH